MRENSELTNLFKNRLSQTEMEVRDGFWETLEQDLSKSIPAVGRERRGFSSRMHRWMVAASVLLVLGALRKGSMDIRPTMRVVAGGTQCPV